MTVCIGAKDHGENIIMVSDHKVNVYDGQFTADETALKCKPLAPTWDVMYAGNDITLVPPIVRDAYEQLVSTYGSERAYSRTEVSDAVVAAYQKALMKRAAQIHLAVYGMDVPTFLRDGVACFGEPDAALMRQRLESVIVDCDFLVCGHDADERAHVFSVERGLAKFLDIGYWAIGSGAQLALSSLAGRRHAYIKGTAVALFHICEAKFVAENASDVGRATFAVMRHKGGSTKLLTEAQIESIRAEWERECRPKYPENAIKNITDMLRSMESHSPPFFPPA
jgi:hypothetical protein